MKNKKYDWQLNASTGNHIAKVNDNTRLVRLMGGGIYTAEFWGDYSSGFPIRYTDTTPRRAIDGLNRAIKTA
jgi:hypothetical protein